MLLEGEVIQILECAGVSSVRIVVDRANVMDLPASTVSEIHLGDRVAVEGLLRVDAVRPLPDADPVPRPPVHGQASDK